MKNNFFLLTTVILWTALSFADIIPSYEAQVPLYDQGRYLGDVKATIEGEKILSLDKASLLDVLKSNLKQDTLRSFESLGLTINPDTLPIPIRFNPQDFRLEMAFDVELRSKQKIDLGRDYRERFKAEAIQPAPFGGAINTRFEQNWTSNPSGEDNLQGQFDSFFNLNSLVLENQSFYQSNIDKKFFRGDTRLVKDFEGQQIRMQAGDFTPQIQGFMASRPLGGINFSRNFSLNPYRLPFSTGSQDFILQSRSFVKYFVNGSIIKSEFLPAGNYTANDIPLNNGLNTIVIEATDDLGQKKVFVFRQAASINLLHEGESRFDLSYGTPIIDQNFEREYTAANGNLFSSFYQYGFSPSFSASIYGQNQDEHHLLGSEIIWATVIGNFGAGLAQSKLDGLSGNAEGLSYQLIRAQTLGLRYEHRNEDFRSSLFDSKSVIQNNYSANLAIPVADAFTLSLGGNYGDVRNNLLADRYGYDATLNIRIFNRHNLAFFVGRNRDENKIWNDIAYVFLTITFPDSNDFVSTFYDQQDKNTKINYNHDNQNRLYSPRVRASLDNGAFGQSGEADILVPTPMAEIGGRIGGDHNLTDDRVYGRGSVRLNSAFVFSHADGEWGAGISRPVTSSFVIFKPEERLKNQKIALKSTSPYTEAESGLFGEITFANLLPYLYREIQLDPTMMDEGRTLQKEKYILYPTYRSTHLIQLIDKGAVMLRGFLLKPDGAPWSLQVGHIGNSTFFTNRDGEFFIEGLEKGNYQLKLEGLSDEVNISVSKDDSGIKNIGTLTIEED